MAEPSGSCDVESHFAGRDANVREIYDTLLLRLRELGGVREEAKKTCIHLTSRSALGGVYPRKSYLILEFKTAAAIDDPRIAKSEQVSRSRFHHTLRLDTPEAVDGTVCGWLREAYEISA